MPELLRSEKWYHGAYICHQECYGGPLDIDKQIDSEGILACTWFALMPWAAGSLLEGLTGDM